MVIGLRRPHVPEVNFLEAWFKQVNLSIQHVLLMLLFSKFSTRHIKIEMTI